MSTIEVFHSDGGTWQQLIYEEGWYYVHAGSGTWASDPFGPHETEKEAKNCALSEWAESHARSCPAEDLVDVPLPAMSNAVAGHMTGCAAPQDAAPEFVLTRWQKTVQPDPANGPDAFTVAYNCWAHRRWGT